MGRLTPPRRAMAPHATYALALVLLGISPAARALTTTTSSSATSDPSCATLQVAAASTARSFPDCPAVLVSVTLTASTEDCASDIEMSMEMEEYPRDVNTFGGESSAALEGKTITWSAPVLSDSTSLSVEFRLDLCGFCATYDNGQFNPIDSFQYKDAEGNEPNDRKKGYQLKLDCEGIEGDPVESIVATPAPVLPPTPAPTVATPAPTVATPAPTVATPSPTVATPAPTAATTTSRVTTPAPTELKTTTAAPVSATPAPDAMETGAPSSLGAAAESSPAPIGTSAPVDASAAPLETQAPPRETPAPTELETAASVSITIAPSSSTGTPAPSSLGSAASTKAPVGTPAPVDTTTAPLATQAPAAATPGPTELEAATSAPVSATAPLVVTETSAPSALGAAGSSAAPVGTPAPVDRTTAPLATRAPAPVTPAPTGLDAATSTPVSTTPSPATAETNAPSSLGAEGSSAAPAGTPAPVYTKTAPLATLAPAAAATPEPTTKLEAATSAPASVTVPPASAETVAPSSLGAAPSSQAPVGTSAPVDPTTMAPLASRAPAAVTPEPTELTTTTPSPVPTTSSPAATATDAPSLLGAAESSAAPVGTSAPVDGSTAAPLGTQAPAAAAAATPEPTAEPEAATSSPASVTAPPVATATNAPSSLGAAPPSAAPVGEPSPADGTMAPLGTRTPAVIILAPPQPGDGATPAPAGMDRGIGGDASSAAPAGSASSTTSAEGGESLTSSGSSETAYQRDYYSAEEGISEGSGKGSTSTSTGESYGASGEDSSRGISSGSYGSASEEEPSTVAPTSTGSVLATTVASTAAPTSIGSVLATTVASTAAPSTGGTDGSRGAFFSTSPSTAPTGAPTALGGDSLQGVTLEIQSIFEARRRALAADVSNDELERRALSVVYAEDAEEYDEEMVAVCASLAGVSRDNVISVSTDFGPDGPLEDAGRRRRNLMTSSSSEDSGGVTATPLTPVTTCEVDLSEGGDTRAMAAAGIVDRMLLPENFVLMLDANRFGPVNAAITSVSFWQNECPADTCPAVGDGSLAAVFPVEGTLENQGSIAEGDSEDGKESLFWFIVLAAALTIIAVLTWCSFCLCCGGSTKRRRSPKTTAEDRYTVKSPVKDELSPRRQERYAAQVLADSDEYPVSGTPPGPSPATPARSRGGPLGRRRHPPAPLSISPRNMAAKRGAGAAEPPSPGEADWRRKFGLGPLRDYTLRSAPVSPRRTPRNGSEGSSKTSSGDPFFATYPDNVVAAADGKRKLVLPPLMDDATAEMESQSTWQVSDDMNASVQHSVDPVVRSSLGKAGMMVANALTSPRRELNRLKEALNKPSRMDPSPSISPTVTASSVDPSSAPGFAGSEGGFSPTNNHHHFASSHFNNVSSPIYEIDLEAEENGGAADAAASGDGAGVSGGTRAGHPNPVVISCGTSDAESAAPSPTSSTATRKSGRNRFAKPPGSVSTRGNSRGPPSSPTNGSTSADRPEANAGGAFSTLATAAAVAEAKVGVMSPTGRAVHALASAIGGSESDDGSQGHAGGSGDEPAEMPALSSAPGESSGETQDGTKALVGVAAAATGAAAALAAGRGKGLEEEEGKSPYPAAAAAAVRVASPGRFGGASSGFGCLAPQLSPRMACSRLPEIDDEEEDDCEDDDCGSGGGDDGLGYRAASAVPLDQRPSLTLSRSRTMSSDLTPIAEVASKDQFSDSETESELSSRASSVNSARQGGGWRTHPRDPAALLASALQRAGQIAAIPPPSSGSPGQIGRPLSAVQEVPMEGVPLPGLFTPTATACSTPRQGSGGGSWGGEESTSPVGASVEGAAVTPIPSPASRPGVLVFAEGGGGLVQAAAAMGLKASPDRSPARSRAEAEEEREEHRVWEKAMEGKTADKYGAQELDSPSTDNVGGVGQGSTTAQGGSALREMKTAPQEGEGGTAAGFSLVGTLVAFFGRKRGEVAAAAPAPAVIPEKKVDTPPPAAPIDVAEEGPEASDFLKSPESHAVEAWPDAIKEDGSKSSLDDGFVDVPAIAEVLIEDEADDDVVFKLPRKAPPPVDLPALVVPNEEETGAFSGPGQRAFNRASMNLQSPGPELARPPPMPALPRPTSPSVSMASSAMKTPIAGVSRISDASPMYDRDAIARAMSQAQAEHDDDKGSDVILPNGAWPSERKQKPYIAASSSISDITSSSGSSYSGSGYSGSGSNPRGNASSSSGSGSSSSSSSSGSSSGAVYTNTHYEQETHRF